MKDTHPLFVVDAFVHGGTFSGNPAAVCLLDKPANERWMQHVASEMNLSETAFAVPNGDTYGLRWFTPTVEVDLCGHATLAAAHVLWNENRSAPEKPLRFETRSGILTCTRHKYGRISMDFPAEPAAVTEPPAGLVEALGCDPIWVGRNRFDLLVELRSAYEVRNLRPDFGQLAAISCRGTIVTAQSDDDKYDLISRFFAPAVGVNEDPVCGSAHCCLGPYWAERLGKTKLRALQASARKGEVIVELTGDRVILQGRAETTVVGRLLTDVPQV